ncbi:MAG TPA: VOC family protein [Burkholderiales bacterium]|jgi:catechol 2,3-dioxygenase-like lactoylglutathione lyase family enzyme|nr:VOC family protein [Burkholderiales bacterium]
MKRETFPRRKATLQAATRGVHHLALTTEDMRMTVDFYTRVVGMPLVHAMKVPPGLGAGPGNRGNPPYEEIRHYFFDMGNDSLLAFFEIPRGAEPKARRDAIGGMQHVAFAVTPKNLAALRKRLASANLPYDGPLDVLPGLVSIYFLDPNGIRLEACCQPATAERPRVIRSVAQQRDAARRELETIEPAWAGATIAAARFR